MLKHREAIASYQHLFSIFIRRAAARAETLKITIMERDDLVILTTFDNANRAALQKSLLESAGIEAYILDEALGTVFPVGGDLEVRLAVATKDEKKARAILAADFDHEAFKQEVKNTKE